MVEQIRAAGGEIYAITSEPQRLADQAKASWDLNYEAIGDPHHEISGACRERGLLEIYVNERTELLVSAAGKIGNTGDEKTVKYSHPKGYFQPGVLALAADGGVLYRWRGTPTRRNMGGATERPTAEYVFEQVEQARAAAEASGQTANAELDLKPKLDSRGIPWPLFVSLLVANGWFIRPKPFPYIKGGPPVQQRARWALARIPFFLGAWVLAFTQMPGWIAGAAFVGWAAWLTPKIRVLGNQFQNIKTA